MIAIWVFTSFVIVLTCLCSIAPSQCEIDVILQCPCLNRILLKGWLWRRGDMICLYYMYSFDSMSLPTLSLLETWHFSYFSNSLIEKKNYTSSLGQVERILSRFPESWEILFEETCVLWTKATSLKFLWFFCFWSSQSLKRKVVTVNDHSEATMTAFIVRVNMEFLSRNASTNLFPQNWRVRL